MFVGALELLSNAILPCKSALPYCLKYLPPLEKHMAPPLPTEVWPAFGANAGMWVLSSKVWDVISSTW